jgi:flagellar biosynthesis/type III secretory pathway protein FliH
LFDEDFDAREQAPEPEVIEPVFSATELASARDAAWREGHEAGFAAAAATETAAISRALQAISDQVSDARAAAAEQADAEAGEIAGLLLDSLAAAFPALCVRYGEAEVRALAAAVLPGLGQEPSITVRVSPRIAPGLAREVSRIDPDIATRVQIVACDAMTEGDVRIAWRNGSAARDAAALWQQVAEILAPAGLLRPQMALKETAYVD